MRISAMDVIPVAFYDPALLNSWDVHNPHAVRTIVRLTTDEGLVGWAETYGDDDVVTALKAARQQVVGRSIYELERLRHQFGDLYKMGGARLFSPIEVACYDIRGKAVGQPVANLLGGVVRERVPFSAYLFYKYADDETPERDPWPQEVTTPEAMLELAKGFVDRYGFKTLKLKGGVLHPDEELETMRLLREHFGAGYPLRIDPNAVWSVETSIRMCRRLAPYDPEYVEDPTKGITGMAQVARHVQVPLSTNMCVVQFDHIPEAVRARAVHVILSDHHFWGGFEATRWLGVIANTFGLGLSMHSNNHLGISMAAMVHLGAAVPNMVYALDTHYPWNPDDILVGEPWQFEDGTLSVPRSPGLGVDVDDDRLGELAEEYVRYREQRPRRERREKGWLPLRPRW